MATDETTGTALLAIAAALQTLADNQVLTSHALERLADAHVAQTEAHAALAGVVRAQTEEGGKTAAELAKLSQGIRDTQAAMLKARKESQERLKAMREQLEKNLAPR